MDDPDPSPPALTVVMPAFNEARQIVGSIRSVSAHLDRARVGGAWELVVVDDGSGDGTAACVAELAGRDPRVRLVRHGRNRGVGQAIATGMGEARGAWAMVIPADLAMDLRDLDRYLDARTPTLLPVIGTGPGVAVVAGFTASRADYGPWRSLVSWTNRHAVWLLSGVRVRNPNYIHLFRMEALRGVPFRFTGSAALYAEMLRRARGCGPIVEVPVRYVPRSVGAQTGAKWSLIVRTAIDLVRLRLGT